MTLKDLGIVTVKVLTDEEEKTLFKLIVQRTLINMMYHENEHNENQIVRDQMARLSGGMYLEIGEHLMAVKY